MSNSTIRWVENIPFGSVPKGFIMQLSDCDYTYDDYLKRCQIMDKSPFYWNLAVLNEEGQIKVFMWGTYEPLEKLLHVLRVTANPKYFTYRGDVLKEVRS